MSIRAADPKLSLRVGAVMIPLLLLLVVYFLVIRDKLFLEPSVTIRVTFSHVGALKEGAPVIVAGRQVGRVRSIQLQHGDDGERAVAIVRIDKKRRSWVPINGDFFVAAKGVFSDRYLEVGPPRDGSSPDRPVENGDVVRGVDPPSMDRVLQNTWRNLTITRAFLDEVRPPAEELFAAIEELSATIDLVEPRPGELDAMRASVSAAIDEGRVTMATLEAGGATPDDVSGLAGRGQVVLARARESIASVRARIAALIDSLDRVRDRLETAQPGLERKVRTALLAADRALDKVEGLRGKVEDLMGIVERGEGTIGRIGSDPEFPEDAKELGKILKRTPWRVIGHPQDDLDP